MTGFVHNAILGKYSVHEYIVSLSGWNRAYDLVDTNSIKDHIVSRIKEIESEVYDPGKSPESYIKKSKSDLKYLISLRDKITKILNKGKSGRFTSTLEQAIEDIEYGIKEVEREIEFYSSGRYQPRSLSEFEESKSDRIKEYKKDLVELEEFSKELDEVFGRR